MKKILPVLSALAVAGTAAAQSSVTLFGVVDAGISRYSTKSSAWGPVPARDSSQRQTVLSSSGNSSSRIGFRGTEDLGAGLAAGFWLEAPVANDSGASGVADFGRRSTLSLSGGFGELRLGRDYTASFWNDAVFDPFGVNGVGTNLIAVVNNNLAASRALATGGLLNGALSAGTDSYVRTSNAISYFLPPLASGVYGQAQYAFPENLNRSDTPGGTPRRGQYAGARVGWASGPADVALAYGQSTLDSGIHGDEKIKTLNAGASYDFGVLKAFGDWSRVRDVQGGAFPTVPRRTDRYDGWMFGVNVPVGAGTIRGSFARVKFQNGNGLPDSGAAVNKLALGYVHNLSKRTALYASVTRIGIRDGHNNPAVMGVTPLVLSIPTIVRQASFTTTGGLEPRSAVGYDFGIRHAF
ncbi:MULTISPECIES: porin [unclassified Variovorax]|uniref:porin n=1 Tax=unclassified Variovorax TaxID=663243 RepID=UPI0008D694C4|nr:MULTISPECIES: porin [unclassified Variovorax]SEK16876.1 Outer membrane protein (porin) [Variovorax sp. OK202]SFE63442.1 Outer membrane protein (porin) [Variovorax sp. OK212]